MTRMEAAAKRHAAEWLRYQKSPQYAVDLAADKQRRAELSRKQGHSPSCFLTRCAPDCQRTSGIGRCI